MDDLLVNRQTRSQIKAFLDKPSHALLITGSPGAGKFAVAQAIAVELLGQDNLENYPYYHHLLAADGKQEISIEQVRGLTAKLSLKTLGTRNIRRVAIIENAEMLSQEAQNALLKNLEEAPSDSVFILTSPSKKDVLPTISSRAQELQVHACELKDAMQFYADIAKVDEVEKAWQLSGGYAGLLNALLRSDSDHPLKTGVEEFKQLLKESRAQRLVRLDKLDKDKQQLNVLLDAGSRILSVLHYQALKQGNQTGASKLLRARARLLTAQELLRANSMPRLLLLDLSLNLEV